MRLLPTGNISIHLNWCHTKQNTANMPPAPDPRSSPGSFITTQISPVSAIGGAGPGYWLGTQVAAPAQSPQAQERGEERRGHPGEVVTLHLGSWAPVTWTPQV